MSGTGYLNLIMEAPKMATLTASSTKELTKLIKAVDSKESAAVNAADKVADFLLSHIYDATRDAAKEPDFLMSFAKTLADNEKIELKYSKGVWAKIKHQVNIAVLIQVKPNAVVDFSIKDRGKTKTYTMTPAELKGANVRQKQAAAAQIRKELGAKDGRADNKRAPRTPETIKTPAATETPKSLTPKQEMIKAWNARIAEALHFAERTDALVEALNHHSADIIAALEKRGYIMTLKPKTKTARVKAPTIPKTAKRSRLKSKPVVKQTPEQPSI